MRGHVAPEPGDAARALVDDVVEGEEPAGGPELPYVVHLRARSPSVYSGPREKWISP